MSVPAVNFARPGGIVLATDLSARSDRALDRATRLAGEWHVPLLVVHAMPPDVSESWPSTDDAPPCGGNPRTRWQRSNDRSGSTSAMPSPAQVAKGEAHDLIVLGASHERSGHSFLGRTADVLIRKSPAPVLVVKNRSSAAYRQILVGTDFTVESRHGLNVATAWFPQASFVLMHALGVPYKSLWLDPARREEFTGPNWAPSRVFSPMPACQVGCASASDR